MCPCPPPRVRSCLSTAVLTRVLAPLLFVVLLSQLLIVASYPHACAVAMSPQARACVGKCLQPTEMFATAQDLPTMSMSCEPVCDVICPGESYTIGEWVGKINGVLIGTWGAGPILCTRSFALQLSAPACKQHPSHGQPVYAMRCVCVWGCSAALGYYVFARVCLKHRDLGSHHSLVSTGRLRSRCYLCLAAVVLAFALPVLVARIVLRRDRAKWPVRCTCGHPLLYDETT